MRLGKSSQHLPEFFLIRSARSVAQSYERVGGGIGQDVFAETAGDEGD
jgi:hypothetical protein